MRIAFISTTYPPMISGVSLTLERLAHGMRDRGHDVLVICASDIPQPYTEESDGIRLVRLRSFLNPVGTGYRFMGWQRRRIQAELKAFSPDVVHLHDPFYVSLAGMYSSRALGIPVVYTVHQLPWVLTAFFGPITPLKFLVEAALFSYGRWFAKKCDALVAPSHMIADEVKSLSKTPVKLISNGIDLDKFNPTAAQANEESQLRAKYALDADTPYLLYIGRMSIEKKVHIVIRAFAKACQQTNAHLILAGDGPRKKTMMRLAKGLGIFERTHFLGIVKPGQELNRLYRSAVAFVMASEVEAQGLVVLEAAASGVPSVGVDATCIPEVIEDGVNGYLVAAGDIDAMAQKIIHLINHPVLARKMGAEGRKLAQQHAIKFTMDKHEALYESLVSPHPAKTL